VASAFSVELLVANTAEGANLFVRKNGAALPAAAVSPVPIGPERATWYRVTAGAYTRRDQADSLLRALRGSRLLADDPVEHVMRTPLALLVDSVPSQGGIADAIRAAVQKYAARGLPVYTLMQDDGGARIYAGAFTTARQSAELIKSLRAAGLKPVLVYRTGSSP
jgi:cell division septation protein DedD